MRTVISPRTIAHALSSWSRRSPVPPPIPRLITTLERVSPGPYFVPLYGDCFWVVVVPCSNSLDPSYESLGVSLSFFPRPGVLLGMFIFSDPHDQADLQGVSHFFGSFRLFSPPYDRVYYAVAKRWVRQSTRFPFCAFFSSGPSFILFVICVLQEIDAPSWALVLLSFCVHGVPISARFSSSFFPPHSCSFRPVIVQYQKGI